MIFLLAWAKLSVVARGLTRNTNSISFKSDIVSLFIQCIKKLYVSYNMFCILDCVCSAVLSPEEDSTQGSKGEDMNSGLYPYVGGLLSENPPVTGCLSTSGREPAVRCRHEHKDCRLWLQQWVHFGQQAGHFLWLAAVRCSRALSGKEVWWTRSGRLEPRGHPLHAGQRITALRWTEPKGVNLFWDVILAVCIWAELLNKVLYLKPYLLL